MTTPGTDSSGASRAIRGGVLGYFALLIGLPLAVLVAHAFSAGPRALLGAISSPIALHALWLTAWSALLVSAVNALMGTVIAWVLTQYPVPGRGLLSAIVDLPLALPTLVVGVVWFALVGPQSAAGSVLEGAGLPVAFAPAGIVVVLLFVTLPLMVRAVEPVLLDLDPSEEEAARTLGASAGATFFHITLRGLAPSITYGALQCFARSLAEFGAVVVISGNVALRTLTAPVYVYGEVESGASQSAAAVSLVLLLAAVGVSYVARTIQRRRVAHV